MKKTAFELIPLFQDAIIGFIYFCANLQSNTLHTINIMAALTCWTSTAWGRVIWRILRKLPWLHNSLMNAKGKGNYFAKSTSFRGVSLIHKKVYSESHQNTFAWWLVTYKISETERWKKRCRKKNNKKIRKTILFLLCFK